MGNDDLVKASAGYSARGWFPPSQDGGNHAAAAACRPLGGTMLKPSVRRAALLALTTALSTPAVLSFLPSRRARHPPPRRRPQLHAPGQQAAAALAWPRSYRHWRQPAPDLPAAGRDLEWRPAHRPRRHRGGAEDRQPDLWHRPFHRARRGRQGGQARPAHQYRRGEGRCADRAGAGHHADERVAVPHPAAGHDRRARPSDDQLRRLAVAVEAAEPAGRQHAAQDRLHPEPDACWC